MKRDTIKFQRGYELLTIGMRLAYMDSRGYLELDTSVAGEEELTEFAYELSDGWASYAWENEDANWDDYIETKIIEKYGRGN